MDLEKNMNLGDNKYGYGLWVTLDSVDWSL